MSDFLYVCREVPMPFQNLVLGLILVQFRDYQQFWVFLRPSPTKIAGEVDRSPRFLVEGRLQNGLRSPLG